MPTHPSKNAGSRESTIKPRLSDVEWGRPLFRAPDCLNPRLVFDPVPFRTQPLFAAAPRRSAAR
jgi:hypothetical protein